MTVTVPGVGEVHVCAVCKHFMEPGEVYDVAWQWDCLGAPGDHTGGGVIVKRVAEVCGMEHAKTFLRQVNEANEVAVLAAARAAIGKGEGTG